MKKLTKEEKTFIAVLVEAQKKSFSFLRGFRKQTQKEIDRDIRYDNLIKKIEEL